MRSHHVIPTAIAILTLLALIFSALGSAHATDTAPTFDLWCNPKADTCSLTTTKGVIELERSELPKYVPMSSYTEFCEQEVCYNSVYQVIGLNPDYTW